MSLGLRAKLFGAFGVVVALCAIVGGVGVLSVRSVHELGGGMYGDRLVPIHDLAQVRADLGDIDSQIQRAITDQSAKNRATYPVAADKDATDMDSLVKKYEATSLVSDE